MNQISFEVNKQAFHQWQYHTTTVPSELAEGQIVIAVDKFALTANNISYAVMGEQLGYWRFFPASNDELGRLPAMGYGVVVESNHPEIKTGERLWGFFPMASHLVIEAGKVSKMGFYDVAPYRENLAPLYSYFERVAASPTYVEALEDYDILLRGLFTTSWLINDFFYDNEFFNAEQFLITSASSKTSIALAFAIKQSGHSKTIGITSSSRVDYVKSLNIYDNVISYDEVETLNSKSASLLVDMAGNQHTLKAVHQHFGDQLKYSCLVGVTHFQELAIDLALPGPKPIMFFAPHQMQKRTQEWGREVLLERLAKSLFSFIQFSQSQFTIDRLLINDTESQQAFAQRYLAVLSGQSDASTGLINQIVSTDK